MISSTSTGDGKNYGLGVEMHKTKLGISYGHDGEFPGYLSDMRFYVDHRSPLLFKRMLMNRQGSAHFFRLMILRK
jgi:hypothetical protein